MPQLPLFPLPLVLFPGVALPLHIFEPRYRQLLADCQAADGRFGIILAMAGPERALPRGRVGCVAELRTVEVLPDGRANIVVEGIDRFAIERVVESAMPYDVADVRTYEDALDADDAPEIMRLDEQVRALFARVAAAASALADDEDALPTLPLDPARLAFAVASLVDLDAAERQALLVSRSAAGRLRDIVVILERAVLPIERRAEVHARSKTNGHGDH